MFSSIRSRLTLWYAAVLSCTLLLLSMVIYWIVKESVLERTDAGLVELSDSFLATLNAELTSAGVREEVAAAARQSILEHRYPGRAFAVVAPSNELLVISGPPQSTSRHHGEEFSDATKLSRALESCAGKIRTPGKPFASVSGSHGGLRCYVRDFSEAGSTYRLVILASLQPESELLGNLRIALGWLVPFTIVLASAGGYFLARRNLAPVADMTARADRISESTLHDRLSVPHPDDEIGRLAQTFNRLLDRLDLAFERQRRFIADASHELRTPVAILQGESEVALSKEGRSSDEYRDSLRILHREARRLVRVVDDMFTLSRADAGQYPVSPREFYLNELAADCAQSLRSLAAAKSISLTVQCEQELVLVGDEALMRRMLLNLLDNAIKYTPEGGKVAIAARDLPGDAEVTVRNDGPGIPAELHGRIFERFFRGDQARSRAHPESGAGLGLSIARWIAEAHHGSLELTQSGPQGTVFTARLPKSSDGST